MSTLPNDWKESGRLLVRALGRDFFEGRLTEAQFIEKLRLALRIYNPADYPLDDDAPALDDELAPAASSVEEDDDVEEDDPQSLGHTARAFARDTGKKVPRRPRSLESIGPAGSSPTSPGGSAPVSDNADARSFASGLLSGDHTQPPM